MEIMGNLPEINLIPLKILPGIRLNDIKDHRNTWKSGLQGLPEVA